MQGHSLIFDRAPITSGSDASKYWLAVQRYHTTFVNICHMNVPNQYCNNPNFLVFHLIHPAIKKSQFKDYPKLNVIEGLSLFTSVNIEDVFL